MQLYLRSAVDLLKPFGLPVYTSGQVPAGAKFPYITLQAAYAPFTQNAAVTIIAWYRQEDGHAQCIAMMDRIWQAIPEQGVLLRYKGGMALLTRAAGSTVTLMTEENDRSVIGGCMRLTVRLYDV